MPWPLIHFSIGYQFNQSKPTPAFLLGNIAPDAVLVREGDREGKLKSHLGRTPSNDELINFVLMNTRRNKQDEDHIEFMFGYIAHIYADLQWSDFKIEISNHNRSLREQLWQEENQMDFELYRNITWREEIKEIIMRAPLIEVNGIYRLDELNLWRRRVFQWYERQGNEPNITNEYITMERVEDFVEETVEGLAKLHKRMKSKLEDGRNFS